jgi:hypothetical protein
MNGRLHAVAFEKFVLFAAAALGALQAAHKENGHAYRDQDGQQVGIRCDPVRKDAHNFYNTTYPEVRNPANTTEVTYAQETRRYSS